MWWHIRRASTCAVRRRQQSAERRVRWRCGRQTVVAISISTVTCSLPSVAKAQGSLTDTLTTLILSQQAPNPTLPKDLDAATQTLTSVAQLVLVEVSTQPLSTSAGGFVYRLNPSIGTVERATSSFGPFFTERALGAGHGGSAIGLTFRAATFNRLQGASLSDGSFPVN